MSTILKFINQGNRSKEEIMNALNLPEESASTEMDDLLKIIVDYGAAAKVMYKGENKFIESLCDVENIDIEKNDETERFIGQNTFQTIYDSQQEEASRKRKEDEKLELDIKALKRSKWALWISFGALILSAISIIYRSL